jgi:YegS/Rv2252/BmrU family lipid kinase
MTFQNIRIIINPAAGRDEPILNTINRVFHPHDLNWQVAVTLRDGDGQRFAQEAVAADADVVVVYGGDGTVKDVANGMIGSDVPLAILPGGTGNALAHKLLIPIQLEPAAQLIVEGHQLQALDLGEVVCADQQRGYFLLRSSIGLQNKLLENSTRELKQQFGFMAYFIAAAQTMIDSKDITYHLSVDGESVTATGVNCLICNVSTIGGGASFDFAPQVEPGDGLLNVFIFDRTYTNVLAAIKSNVEMDLSQYPSHWSGREISVETSTPEAVSIDGEPIGDTPIQVRVLPQVVKVLVPAQQETES